MSPFKAFSHHTNTPCMLPRITAVTIGFRIPPHNRRGVSGTSQILLPSELEAARGRAIAFDLACAASCSVFAVAGPESAADVTLDGAAAKGIMPVLLHTGSGVPFGERGGGREVLGRRVCCVAGAGVRTWVSCAREEGAGVWKCGVGTSCVGVWSFEGGLMGG